MGRFTLVSNIGKKISLEQNYHACPKCKNNNSVQLTRSERAFILFNKTITENSDVRYECYQCKWKNQMLPIDPRESEELERYLSETSSTEDFYLSDISSI